MSRKPTRSGSRRYAPIGKYEILSHIATGGMAAVYRARDIETGQTVALKVLSPALAEKPVLLERFRREAQRGIRLRHPNLVTIFEFSEENGLYFLALEFVDGVDLHDYIAREGKLDASAACPLLIQAVRALDYLHQQNVVHRDIKPSNFLIARDGERSLVKLTDLGLARELTDEEFRVTHAGLTVGTVDYMAPEQARNSSLADIRSDIYALGCTFYHMLTGRPPFPDGGLMERLYKHAEAEPPDVRRENPSVPPAVVKMLRRMLAKQPDERFQTPHQLLSELLRLDELRRGVGTVLAKEESSHETPPEQPAFPAPSSSLLATRTSAAGEARPEAGDVSATVPAVPEEQQRAAAGQYERAKEVIATGNEDYAIHLLRSCCKLDPLKLTYRKVLRKIEKDKYPNSRRGWKSWATNVAAKAKLKAALQSGEYLKALDLGENVLAKDPWDRDAHEGMARAAEAAGIPRLAIWIMKELWEADRESADVNRELGRLYEVVGDFARAINHWKIVAKVEPDDLNAPRQLQDLSARLTLARGQYEEQLGNDPSLKIRLRRA